MFSIISCKNEIDQFIPPKNDELSNGTYDKYVESLKEAYHNNDKLNAALQLANLKADKEITFTILEAGIKEDLSNCDKIYNWYWLYDRNNFGVNIVKLDTSKFKNAVQLCDKLYGNYSYLRYAELKDQNEKDAVKNRKKEDSSAFNLTLVAELEQISLDDQEVRKKLMVKNIASDLENKLLSEMHVVDSINLLKIDKIFQKYGYPSIALVGKDCNFTPALIIHHNIDLTNRNKYLPILEKAVSDGLLYQETLNMIKHRIADIELDEN